MISEQIFIFLIKDKFYFLESQFDFTMPVVKSNSREYIMQYKKGELIVRIIYSLTNNHIEIIIYNHTSIVPPGKYDWRYSVSLMYLMKKDIGDFDYKKHYESIMPKNIPFEKSISELSILFKKYASSILENKEWVSWGEIAG